jgi:hypothetical protein
MKLMTYQEFRDLTRASSASEYESLENNILKYGCRHPIITWGDIIIDGHKRYAICQKHNLPFTVNRMEFGSFAEAKRWARRHANFVAQRKEIFVSAHSHAETVTDGHGEPLKRASKPMLAMPPNPVVRFRKFWEIDTMTPADVNEFVFAIGERLGLDFLKEFVFVLFTRIASRQDTDATRRLFQQLYNLHYTPSFTER